MNVITIDSRRHIYELTHCSGCNVPVGNEYVEIGLPSVDGSQIKHIALCNECSGVAELEGVI